MEMQVTDLAAGVLKVTLTGRLDTPGVGAVETRFTASLVPRAAHAVVDLANVSFAGSLAIRMFITVARALAKRGGKLVLFAPQALVSQSFASVALNDIVPVLADEDAAVAAVRV